MSSSFYIQLLQKSAKGEFVAFFRSFDSTSMDVIVADFQQKKLISNHTLSSTNAKNFIQHIPKLFDQRFKAIILNVFTFNAIGYEHNLQFCHALREAFFALHIPTYFMLLPEYVSCCFFIATNTTVEIGDTVLQLIENDEHNVAVLQCKYTSAGYEKKFIGNVDCRRSNVDHVRGDIIRLTNPKKIVCITNTHVMEVFLKKLALKGFDVETIRRMRIKEFDVQFVVEMSKWLLDKTYTKYYFPPRCARDYFIGCYAPKIPTPKEILLVEAGEKLPLIKNLCIPRTPLLQKIDLGYSDPINGQCGTLQTLDVIKDCHYNEFILTVDSESFPHPELKSCFFPKIIEMPKVLDKAMPSKVPFVGIHHSGLKSVICYCKNDESGYEFLDSWNGMYGNDLLISFKNKKPIFGSAVLEQDNSNPGAFFTDIIKVMSMPNDKIEVNEFWDFKITKDVSNPVLLEFNIFDGSRKLATPAFLMAMLLRQHVKAIKAATGKKPTTLGFCFFDNYSKDEQQRIEKGIKDSCKLLKIACVFYYY